MCGGKNCAKFFQYYTRRVIDENGTYFKEFPIARFKCHGKGFKNDSKGNTFSLLPYQLVPYTKYSIPFIFKVLKARHINSLSIYKVQEYIDTICVSEILPLDSEQLLKFKQLIVETIDKILIDNNYKENKELFEYTGEDLLKYFINFAEDFICRKVEPCIRGPSALGLDYYLNGGGYINNAYFLLVPLTSLECLYLKEKKNTSLR